MLFVFQRYIEIFPCTQELVLFWYVCTKSNITYGKCTFLFQDSNPGFGETQSGPVLRSCFAHRAPLVFHAWNRYGVSQNCLAALSGSGHPWDYIWQSLCPCLDWQPVALCPSVLAQACCLPFASAPLLSLAFMAHFWLHAGVCPFTKWCLAAPGSLLLLHAPSTQTHTHKNTLFLG